MKIKKFKISIAQMLFYAVITAGAVYLYERSEPVTDYFEYYGNVPTKDVFMYPDLIENYAFGKSDHEPLHMDFLNELWCTPLGSNRSPTLTKVRTNTIDEYKFVNETPDIPLYPITKNIDISRIGKIEMDKIRANGANFAWNMGDAIPSESSICYVTAKITTPSTIFSLPKTIEFTGTTFDYIYPDEQAGTTQ